MLFHVVSDWWRNKQSEDGQNERRIIGQAVAWQRRDASIRDVTLELDDQQADIGWRSRSLALHASALTIQSIRSSENQCA